MIPTTSRLADLVTLAVCEARIVAPRTTSNDTRADYSVLRSAPRPTLVFLPQVTK